MVASPKEARLQRTGKLRDDVLTAVRTIYEFREHQTSCGLMVIRVAALRMLGFPVARDIGWDPNLLRLDFIPSLRTCMMDNAMRGTIQGYASGTEVGNYNLIEGEGTQQDPINIS